MRTYINIEQEIIDEALKLAKLSSNKELFQLAIEEFIHSRKALNLMDLKGKVKFDDDYDYKSSRKINIS